jgi:23S rRNA (uracil1939-C5)-methyltransferase
LHDRRARAGAPLELVVERLTYGPDALARDADGRVVFLDSGLPGERVRAVVTEERRDFARAHVTEVLADPTGASPAPARRVAPCPIVASCGGCAWQHIAYAVQLEQKLAVALREIERACGTRPQQVLPSIPAAEWRTRSRIRLAVDRQAGGKLPVLGYRARGSHRVVPLDDCLIAGEALIAGLPAARAIAGGNATIEEVELLADDRGDLRLRARSSAPAPCDARALLEAAAQAGRTSRPGVVPVGLRLESALEAGRRAAQRWAAEAGDSVQQIDVAPGLVLHVPLGVFTQVSLAQNRLLVAEVMRHAAPPAGSRVLDLYAGCGNFSLPLARAGADVTAVETDSRAARAARDDHARLPIAGRGSFTVLDAPVERALAAPGLRRDFVTVVLDPPRAGAAPALAAIARLRAACVVYVSCDVATFARDAARLLRAGYVLVSFQVVDLTPQTYRAEGIGVFRLT